MKKLGHNYVIIFISSLFGGGNFKMAMEGKNISCSPCKRPLESSSNGNAVGKRKKCKNDTSNTKEEYVEARRWILENYKPTTRDVFISTKAINKAFNNDHPNTNMFKNCGWIGKIIIPLWGKQVYYTRRSVCANKSIRVQGYAGLARKTTEQLAQELKSVLFIPKVDLVFPGWTVEYFEEPPGLHYSKRISNIYVDKQPMTMELNLTSAEDYPATADHQFLNNCKLNASILCRGVVVQGHKTGIWDNTSIPTWERVKNLLTVLDSLSFCFGFDLPSECIDEYSLSRRKTFTLYENIKDVLADKGKKRQVSTECELLLIVPAWKLCSACVKLKNCQYKKKKRHLLVDEKADAVHKNQRYMSRDELKNRIKALHKEVSKLRHQNARMKEKLENDSSSDDGSDDSNDKSDDADGNDETHESDVDGDSGSDNDSDDEDRGDCDGSDDDDDNTSDNEDTKAKCRIDSSGDLPVESTEDCATESLEGLTKVVISNLSYIENIFD